MRGFPVRYSGMCCAATLAALLAFSSSVLSAEEKDPTAPALPGEKRPATPPPAASERPKIRKWLEEPQSQNTARAAADPVVVVPAGPEPVLPPITEPVVDEDEITESAAERAQRRAKMDHEIKCRLLDAKLAFKRGDYQMVVNIARNIMSMDPRNVAAAEWLRKAQGKMLDADESVVGVAGDRRDRERMLEVDEHSVPPPPRLKELRPRFARREDDVSSARRQKIADKLNERVTVDFNKAELDFVLNTLFVLTGINIIADEAAIEGKTVTMRVLDLPVREVLNFIVRNNEAIQYNITEDAVWITASESNDLKKIMYPRIYPIHFGLVSTTEGSGASTGQRSSGTGRAGGGGGGGRRGGGNGGGGGGGATDLEPSYLETVLKWMKENKDPQVFPEGSDYMVDRQSNNLIVYTTATGHERIREFMDAFDQPAIQVLIKARFLDVSGLNEKELGVNIDNIKTRLGTVGTSAGGGTGGGTGTDTDTDPTAGRNPFRSFSFTGATQAILGTGNVLTVTGRRTDPLFQVTLTALLQSRFTKVLSEPQILAINNKQAIIDITQHFSYITDLRPVTTTTAVGNGVAVGNVPRFVPEFDEENIGFTLQVTPSVGRDLKTINLHLNPVIDELATGQSIQQFQNFDASIDAANQTGEASSIQRPTINQTSLETDVVLEDNGYVLIGGLMRNFKESRERKIPGLHRIPYLGNLFKTRSTTVDRRNLMIIVEAQIINPRGRTYYKDDEPDDADPREGGTNRSPGQISDAIRANAVNSSLGFTYKKPFDPKPSATQNPEPSEPRIDAPRRSRPVTPDSQKALTQSEKKTDDPDALTPRERMERLARATRASTAQAANGVGWTVASEEAVPGDDARGEVVVPPAE
ncbi:MAG TPA: hypothetical protein VEK08_10270 [Planctomycetota bacterium]|nr:hypothetical protein [Planctomycetota bacterium]